MKQQDNPGQNDREELGARYLTFYTDGQLFGLPITEIVQITKMQEIVELPEHPPYVKGVIDLRGQIIPVVDVRLRFGKIEESISQQTVAIEQIRDGLTQISSVVQTNAATAEENSAASEEMSAQAAALRGEVGKFKLAENRVWQDDPAPLASDEEPALLEPLPQPALAPT